MNGPNPGPELLELLQGMRTRFASIDKQLMGLQADIAAYTSEATRPDHEEPRPAPREQTAWAPPTWERPVTPPPPPRPEPTREPIAAKVPYTPPKATEPMWLDRQFEALGKALKAWRGDLNLSDFLGLRALAWIGGIITLLGIAFFYVLADQQGWVGPGSRVLLGTALSAGLLGLAGWLRHLKDQPEAALAAAGTGIAGLYVTLFAATKLYDYIPTAGGMPLALSIAALAVAIALAWSSQPLALLGLTGAALAPPLVEGGSSTPGVAFAAIVAAAAMALWVERNWKLVPAMVSAATVPQLAWLLAEETGPAPAFGWNTHWQTVALAGGFWALYVTAGFAHHLRREKGVIEPNTLHLFATTATAAILSAGLLFDESDRGWAMLGVAALHGALAFLPGRLSRANRNLSSVFGAAALASAGIATGELLGGGARAVAFAGEAALLVWLSSRFREQRFQYGSLAYLAVAAGFALYHAPPMNLVDFPPHRLGGTSLDSSLVLQSIAGAAALAIGAIAFALFSRPMGVSGRDWRRITGGVALGASLYAASHAILDGFIRLHFTQRSFENGHTVVSLAVALVGVALLVAGLRRRSTDERTAGLILLGAAVTKLFLYDLVELNLMARAAAFIAVGLLMLAGGIVYQRLWEERPAPPVPA
ncbi:MAG: hypothetical protein QOJ13_2384 [Gaiellales bacterium]|nr:hypothetical protein [Gaiellales bacterium]